MTTDRKEYMRQYRAAQKAKAAGSSNVLQLHEHVREQHEQFVTVPEQHEHVTNMLRTDEHLEPQAVRVPVTNTAVTVRTPVRNSTNMFANSSNTSVTVFKHPLAKYLSTVSLVIFIGLNTSFLISEQISFYVLKGESFWYSFFIASLTELAAIFLSFFGTWYRRPVIFSLLIPTLLLIFSVIYLGLERKETVEEVGIQKSDLLKKEIETLENQERAIIKQAEEGKKVETILSRIQTKLTERRTELRTAISASGSGKEIWILAALRVMAIIWNIAFSSLIAFVWKGKSNVQLFPKGEMNEGYC